ncbi:hypothetical protein RFI_16132 [Reticulomyxa filosa]|uniref:PITH domain-containing protein n=1 Tax=Reticulomyxa filosa TaxID=46433 RepID=X6N4W2_RETFI|nr:hypothetical protein RFI_16132 [Reticulomyxa filosa]|eukprot:ETO21071.1 hypothetical protein RFI_16132 [Reticulomyxa filosa]
MSSCKSEAHEHGHGHDDHDKDCEHNHDGDSKLPENDIGASLYQYIDTESVHCFNEQKEGTGKLVFKQWTERNDNTKFVVSDTDEEPELLCDINANNCQTVLVNYLFFKQTKKNNYVNFNLFFFEIKRWKDKEEMDFEDAHTVAPHDQFNLIFDDKADYFTKVSKWTNTTHITMLFQRPNASGHHHHGSDDDNDDDDDEEESHIVPIRINYIGLKGEWRSQARKAVKTVYESKPMPTDHQTKADTGGQSSYIS